MPKPFLRKCLSDGGHAEVVKTTGRRYKLNDGQVLAEAIAAAIEPTMYRPKLEMRMRLDLKTLSLGALLSIIAEQQRGQPVLEDKDPACRLTAKRRGTWSVAAGDTKPRREVLVARTVNATAPSPLV